MDGIPDQWKISNREVMNANISDDHLLLQTQEESYIYTNYPIRLVKGNKYRLEVQTENSDISISYYIPGITRNVLTLMQEGNKYTAELLIEQEPNENGNELRIYVSENCSIKNILIKKIKNE